MASLPSLTLVLGGQRSGKSAYAERLFPDGGFYLATGQAFDGEMTARIQAHQDRRGEGWTCVEEPLNLAQALSQIPHAKPVLLDSLGMWVSNMLAENRDIDGESLAASLYVHPAPMVVVSEEVGLGVIPMDKVARAFVDALGLTNQSLAARADLVVLVTAGLPRILKDETSS